MHNRLLSFFAHSASYFFGYDDSSCYPSFLFWHDGFSFLFWHDDSSWSSCFFYSSCFGARDETKRVCAPPSSHCSVRSVRYYSLVLRYMHWSADHLHGSLVQIVVLGLLVRSGCLRPPWYVYSTWLLFIFLWKWSNSINIVTEYHVYIYQSWQRWTMMHASSYKRWSLKTM